MNQTSVTICGRLVAEPEVKQTAKGEVTNLRVVVNERRRDPQGNYTDGPSSFYTVSAWGDLGSEVAQCLHKGHAVLVRGILRVNSFKTDGRTLERVEVQAEHIGPDLKWGTAMYRSRPRGERAAVSDQRPPYPQHSVGYDDQQASQRTEPAADQGYEVLGADASAEELDAKLAAV